MMKIPQLWEEHLKQGSNFGKRVLEALDSKSNAPARKPRWNKGQRSQQIRDRLHQIAITTNVKPLPFSVRPKINLVYHIWPCKGGWQWHTERLRDLIPLCDGQIIIGVSTDKETDSIESVKAELPFEQIHWIETPNLPLMNNVTSGYRVGELQTAVPAMQMLDLTDDSVTIYAHAKGQRPHTIVSEPVKIWTQLMYESVVFRIDEAIERFSEGYSAFGSMRTFGLRPLMPRYKWHYSGTFFLFRTRDFMSGTRLPDFQMRYGGTEAWPGDCIPSYRSYCTLGDNIDIGSCYNLDSIYEKVTEHLNKVSHSYGPVQMQQHYREFEWLKPQFSDMRRVLVIGSYNGGLEYYLSKKYPQVEFISVDIQPQDGNVAPCMIVGSSSDPVIQEKIKEIGQFDGVFIDGDHSYEGVKLDWEFAQSLHPKKIWFHDIAESSWHEACGSFAHHLWREIKVDHQTDEKIVGCGWGGIGVVKL